jgi:cysteinyl-tRNA synthetase
MGLKVFNTLSRSVEEFVPLDPDGKKVGMYCCGPTVHDFAHIGNFRTFVFTDLVRRYLDFKGYDVTHVMNITDVEDKIIRKVRESGDTLEAFTKRYTDAFLEDVEVLGCLPPHKRPHATKYIGPIIALIKKLVAKGIAYHAPDGSVYFSIDKYRGCGCCYGQLLKLNFDEMRVGDRVADDEYEKESVADFALWKARVPEDGEVFWKSPWGEGRPGWHIECSAMSTQILGASFDLHLGGEDLVFPHHEDEIAQSEGALDYGEGARFVKYWLHGSHLLVEGKKMSKSLGNFFTLRDLLEKGFNGREIRYLMISAHYREQFNFTIDGLTGAKSALGRLDECLIKLREIAVGATAEAESAVIGQFEAALDDDLNVAAAWGAVFEWIREKNRMLADGSIDPVRAAAALAAWERINAVLGIAEHEIAVPAEIQTLAEERQAARKAKDFARSDEIRDQLASQGWVIEDTPKGPRVKRQ